MAAPTAPTLITITTEGLKKAGYSSPAALLARAKGEFMEEIKNDIVNIERKLTSLQATSIMVTSNGQSRYALPVDFLSDLTIVLLDGSVTGTAQAGTTDSITLAADDDSGSSDRIGKEILITANTAAGSMSQITAYNATTKVATVTPDFNTAPDNTSTYMLVERYRPLSQHPVWELDKVRRSSTRNTPISYFPTGDANDGEICLDPIPFRDSAVPWGIQLRYYADLMELDLAGTLMATLYKKWRNVWTLGVAAKQLRSDDDNRQEVMVNRYFQELEMMVNREKYGYDLTNLQSTVLGYE